MSEQTEVIYAEVVEGDYNDVYDRHRVKGTWDQIETYVKSFFSKEGLEVAEEIGTGDGYGLQVWEELPDTLTDWETDKEVPKGDPRYEELAEEFDSQVEYYVEALPFDERDKDLIKELEASGELVDLDE
jgi:predicted glycoside hydrolase/deacetylase ChbG (UPF0249 family)